MEHLPLIAMLSALLAPPAAQWAAAFEESFPEEDRGNVSIADLDDALTFARVASTDGHRVIAVTGYRGGIIDGIDLSTALGCNIDDAATLFVERGYDRLRDDVRSAPAAARVSIEVSRLVIAVDFSDDHIAVGTNYPEHAADAGTVRPFLFPKLVQPGLSGDPVSVRGGLLDYEVEIAVLPLEPLPQGEQPRFLGLMLANDFTDRETLMHAVDRNDIESGKGFTTGKSFPGYLPVGNLLVIPRDWRAFVGRLELRLFVNDALRQRSRATEMVWDVDRVLAETWLRKDLRWQHRAEQVALFDGDAISARTLVLTGTPHGTVFSGVPGRVIAAGLLRWLWGGWTTSIPEQVIEAYVDAARTAKAYLQPGDEVAIHVHYLGELRSTVVP